MQPRKIVMHVVERDRVGVVEGDGCDAGQWRRNPQIVGDDLDFTRLQLTGAVHEIGNRGRRPAKRLREPRPRFSRQLKSGANPVQSVVHPGSFRKSETPVYSEYPKSRLTGISENQKIAGMEPACSIIKKLGGEAVVSRITGTAYTAPYRWQHPRDRGGTGGLIPQRHYRTLLDHAKLNGIPLTADDFLPAREASSSPEAA